MPSALRQAATGPSTYPRIPCSVGVALADLAETDPESHADIMAWLRGDDLSLGTDSDVHRGLQKLGYRVRKQMVGRHRRGVRGTGDSCSCVADA